MGGRGWGARRDVCTFMVNCFSRCLCHPSPPHQIRQRISVGNFANDLSRLGKLQLQKKKKIKHEKIHPSKKNSSAAETKNNPGSLLSFLLPPHHYEIRVQDRYRHPPFPWRERERRDSSNCGLSASPPPPKKRERFGTVVEEVSSTPSPSQSPAI